MLCLSCAQVLEQAWPFFGMYMDKLLREKIQPSVRFSSSALRMFTFTKIHFGRVVNPPEYSYALINNNQSSYWLPVFKVTDQLKVQCLLK